MTPFLSKTGIKARLLSLMALIILPIALASVLIASRNYWSAIDRVEAERAQIANDFAVRTRIWYRGAMRSLLATYSAIEAGASDASTCGKLAAASLKLNIGYSALRITLPDGTACMSTVAPVLTRDILDAIAAEQALKPSVKAWIGPLLAPTRYDVFRTGTSDFLVIHLDMTAPGGLPGAATLLVEPTLLDAVFDIGPLEQTTVALVKRGIGPVVARGVPEDNKDWLPIAMPETTGFLRFEASSQGGDVAAYSITPIAGTDLLMLARFPGNRIKALGQQYLFMALTPIAILGLLFLAYMRAIQNDVLRWIMGIKLAARARIEDAHSQMLAPVGDDMPRELRSVATAFNTMVTEGQTRERDLVTSLDKNRHLVRELHHRVKNSLQVIQSYLALSRRQKAEREQGPLAEIEARVLVLSIAYRLALGEGGMRAVDLQPFATEVVNNLSSTLKRDDQKIAITSKADAALDVDQVIPFGLAIVECVSASLASPACAGVHITVARVEPNTLELTISAMPAGSAVLPNEKVLRGLRLQLGAEPMPVDEAALLRWRLSAQLPPA